MSRTTADNARSLTLVNDLIRDAHAMGATEPYAAARVAIELAQRNAARQGRLSDELSEEYAAQLRAVDGYLSNRKAL
ncbi:MAG: hypothetical protein JWO67_3837 [Streptosporangiaceae bacterium]|nr:hypothetical protein [Streptosporangiaceae bacterium]